MASCAFVPQKTPCPVRGSPRMRAKGPHATHKGAEGDPAHRRATTKIVDDLQAAFAEARTLGIEPKVPSFTALCAEESRRRRTTRRRWKTSTHMCNNAMKRCSASVGSERALLRPLLVDSRANSRALGNLPRRQ